MNNKQQLEYLLRIRKIREVMVVKDNIHLTYKYKNRNQAFKQVENLQDKIINHVIDDVLFGNVGELKNIEKTTSKIINDTLVNERKRIHRIDDRFVNHAVKSNAEIFSGFFNNRLNNINSSLQLRIEEELRKNSIRNLSDSEIRKILSEKYADTGKARLKNIVKDSIHTNESNISFIQALNEGYSYKVWMNGRSKGKTRPWHRARIIASVPIDEYFDIYGSYHAELMYPGDLNGGAENVANCRCWLRYTNRTPSNLKKKSSFNIPPSSYLHGRNKGSVKQNGLRVNSKSGNKITRTISNIGNKIKNIRTKITEKIKQNILSLGNKFGSNFNKQFTIDENPDINIHEFDEIKVKRKLRDTLPKEFSDESIDYILDVLKKRGNASIEYGQSFNYKTGKPLNRECKGIKDEVDIDMENVDLDQGEIATQHNHPSTGLRAPSGHDFFVAMGNTWEDYKVIISKNEIWVIEAKGRFDTKIRNTVYERLNEFAMNSMKKANSKNLEKGTFERWEFLNESYGGDVKKYINFIENINIYQVIL